MPSYEQFAKSYPCPGWWPWQWFKVCHEVVWGWCYNFGYYKETQFLFYSSIVACEGGVEYSWSGIGLGLGSQTHYNIRRCFVDRLEPNGKCGESYGNNYGAITYYPKSEIFVSDLKTSVKELSDEVVENGKYDSAKAPTSICRSRIMTWRRSLHEEEASVAVDVNLVQVQWAIAGSLLTSEYGDIEIGVLCRWSLPLFNGRTESRVVHLRYKIIRTPNESILKIYNNPADGCFDALITMTSVLDGQIYQSKDVVVGFVGESIRFEREDLDEERACILKLIESRRAEKRERKSRLRTESQQIVKFRPEFSNLIREHQHEMATMLMEIVITSYYSDPAMFIWACQRLEEEIGIPAIARFISVSSVHRKRPCPCNDCG